MIIAIAGGPGTGTTTLSLALANTLSLPVKSAGDLFRSKAKALGISLQDYCARSESDPRLDVEFDAAFTLSVTRGDWIVEGRMAFWYAKQSHQESFSVLLMADAEARARRISVREGEPDVAAVQRAIEARESSELARLKGMHGFDPSTTSQYDIALSTTGMTREQVRDAVLAALVPWMNAGRFPAPKSERDEDE